jgi:hypothetical protein
VVDADPTGGTSWRLELELLVRHPERVDLLPLDERAVRPIFSLGLDELDEISE